MSGTAAAPAANEAIHSNDSVNRILKAVQERAIPAAEERTRLEATLEALLSSIEDAALVVDADGTPVRANAVYHRLIGDSALVPLDEQGQPLPPEATPQQRAARGETFTMEFLLPPRRGAARRRRFEARGRPIRVGDTVHGGLIILRARAAK